MPDMPRRPTPPPDLAVLLEETGDHTDSQKLTITKSLMIQVTKHLADQDASVDEKFARVDMVLNAIQKDIENLAASVAPPGEHAYLMRAEKERERRQNTQHRQQMEALAYSQALSRRSWKVFQAVLALVGVIAVSVFGIALTTVLQHPDNASGPNVVKASGAILVVLIVATAVTLYRVTPLDITPVRAPRRAGDPPDEEDAP